MATTKTAATNYKLTLTGGAFSMRNRPVPEAIAVQIVRIVMGDSGGANPVPRGAGELLPPGQDSDSLGTPKQFLAAKKPQTDVERIATLAFHLTYGGKQPHFKTKDLTKLNTDAAGPRLSNASFAARNAVNAGLLAAAGKGNKQISPLGEEVVKALPDRAAVKAALEAAPKRKRRAKPTRTKKSR
jgi:hypothetical protein